jgi:D-alanyl-D-alanine-carboxypeptidase/D-alanyl-D-alanine-endopeptidase
MTIPQRALILLLIGFCAWSGALTTQAQQLTKPWVEKVAAPLVAKRVIDGLSIGYIEGDGFGIVHLGSAGEAGRKADNGTVYEIGSLSKVFTGLLLADAALRDEINLYTAVDVANPAGMKLPSRDGRSIKWIDLSTHRSGLPRLPGNLTTAAASNPYRDYDSKQAAAFLQTYQLPRQPGKAQEYSNFGASVLGYLVAAKAGKTYDELLQERIAGPLKMADCTVALSSDQQKRLATPHDKFGSAVEPWAFADLPGAGGIHATLRDMMRFAKAQLEPPSGPIGEAIELAWKQHTEADETGPAMGLGWIIAGDGQTRLHNGQTGGTTSALFINRKLKCAVVILCNTSVKNDEIDKLALQMVMKAAGQETAQAPEKKGEEAEAPEDLAIDEKLRRRLVGRYQLKPDFIFTVTDDDGRLMVGITNQETQEVFPDSPTRWSYRGIDATLEFKLPKTGVARSLILHQNGASQTARRVK